MATPKTILLKGDGIYKEGVAAAGITPGHLVERASAGTIQVHSTAAGNAVPMFAKENDVIGNEITEAYVATDQVQMVIPQRGSEIYALVAAGAAAIVIGNYLESAGDGTLRLTATNAATANTLRAGIVARALEAVDNSGGGSAVRIKVEIL